MDNTDNEFYLDKRIQNIFIKLFIKPAISNCFARHIYKALCKTSNIYFFCNYILQYNKASSKSFKVCD